MVKKTLYFNGREIGETGHLAVRGTLVMKPSCSFETRLRRSTLPRIVQLKATYEIFHAVRTQEEEW